MIKPDTLSCSPSDESAADVFRAVIATNNLRFAAPLDDLIQRPYDPLRWQREINVDGQGFPVEVVDDVE